MTSRLWTFLAIVLALAPAAPAQEVAGELLLPNIAHFWLAGQERSQRSGAVRELPLPPSELPDGFSPRPRYERGEDGEWRVLIPVEAGTSLYGVGAAGGGLLRNGRRFEGRGGGEALPWVFAVRADGTVFGALADSAAAVDVDLADGIAFGAPDAQGRALDVVVIAGDSPRAVLTGLTDITGPPTPAPMWALGYHLSSPMFSGEKKVHAAAGALREHGVPSDALWIAGEFEDPLSLSRGLAEMGFRTVWSGPAGPAAALEVDADGWVMPGGTRAERAAMHEALMRPGRRPFVLAEPELGSQSHAAAIFDPGPDAASEEVIGTILNLGLSGQALCGPGPRWSVQLAERPALAALFPLAVGSIEREEDLRPLADEGSAARRALERRYRLLPYLYTLSFRSYVESLPIARPAFFADMADQGLRTVQDVFLLGEDLLVAPGGADSPRPEPFASWPRLTLEAPEDDLPALYIRPGSIVPIGPAMMRTGGGEANPLTLVVALDSQGGATGRLYEDAGDGFEMFENMARMLFYQARIAETDDGRRHAVISLVRLDGGMGIPQRRPVRVRLLHEGGELIGEGSERGSIRIDLP